ncbi:MAG: preprotein translocase subunit SecG [Candidatus Hydrogenedens sp.]|nr:preprotein translocase subunit SecG [Candidatus Hydrogenedens sp.]
MQDLFNVIFSWNALWYLLMLLYVPACLGLIIIVLLQKGKGMGLAGAFGGGGGAETVFGPRTSRSLPQRLTYTMAGIFMTMAIVMSLLSGRVNRGAAPELVTPEQASAMQSESIDALFEEGSESAPADASGEAATDVTPVQVTPMVDGNAVVIDPSGSMSEDDAKAAAASVDESAAPAEAATVDAPAEEAAPAADAAPAEDAAAEAAAPEASAPAAETPAEAPAEEAPAAAETAEQPQ